MLTTPASDLMRFRPTERILRNFNELRLEIYSIMFVETDRNSALGKSEVDPSNFLKFAIITLIRLE